MTNIFPTLFYVFNGVVRNIYPQILRPSTKRQSRVDEIPELGLLQSNTRMRYRDIVRYFDAFKKKCPDGTLTYDMFKSLYRRFYPKGRIKAFTKKAFKSFDRNGDGHIDFTEFILALDVMGTKDAKKKFDWFFQLSDTNKNGVIDTTELDSIQASINEMLLRKHKNNSSSYQNGFVKHRSSFNEETARYISMDAYDTEGKGFLTKPQFMELCKHHHIINQILYG